MKGRLAAVAVGLGVLAVAAGYQLYLDTEHYRARFEPKFRQLKVGDTYQRMRDVLGHPTHRCKVHVKASFLSSAPVVAIERYEIYRIAEYDYRVHFAAEETQPTLPIAGLDVIPRSQSCLATKYR